MDIFWIREHSIKDTVEEFYAGEGEQFFSNYHKVGGTKDECVAGTVKSISGNAEMFVVKAGEERAAFFVRTKYGGKLFMEGFHIKKEFRTKEFILKFWKLVKKKFNKVFYIGIYIGNIPANNHLVKNGFKFEQVLVSEGKKFIILKS